MGYMELVTHKNIVFTVDILLFIVLKKKGVRDVALPLCFTLNRGGGL